jgi:ABC-type Fe3+ transport system permease subunit
MSLIQLFHVSESTFAQFLYDRTIAAPVLAQFIKALPLATLVMWQAVSSVPQELLDSAAVDGAGRCDVLWRVALPLVRRSIGVAWLVALAVAIGDLAASILLLPPGVNTLANHVFGLIHYGVDDQVAGITLAMIGAFAVLGFVARIAAVGAPRS